MSVDLRDVRWYVLVDDLVGGYAIANVDKKRVSALDWRQGDSTVGEFISEDLAEYVVKAHNLRLDILQAAKEGHFDSVQGQDPDLPGASGQRENEQG